MKPMALMIGVLAALGVAGTGAAVLLPRASAQQAPGVSGQPVKQIRVVSSAPSFYTVPEPKRMVSDYQSRGGFAGVPEPARMLDDEQTQEMLRRMEGGLGQEIEFESPQGPAGGGQSGCTPAREIPRYDDPLDIPGSRIIRYDEQGRPVVTAPGPLVCMPTIVDDTSGMSEEDQPGVILLH